MAQRPSFALPVTRSPKQGPRALPVSLVLVNGVAQIGDLELEQGSNSLDYAQSVYIDNSANNATFTIVFPPMGYSIVVKANQQGTWPLLVGPGPLRWTATLAAGGTVKMIFANIEQFPATWGI